MEGQPCLFCGGNAAEPDHLLHCDGRQGAAEAAPPPPVTTITAPRDTSVQAFYNAVDTGVIRTRREQVYAALRVLGDATANEVFEYLKEQRHLGLRYDSNTRARLTELRDMGVIRETGQRPCRVTHQTCITWAIVTAAEYVGTATVHRCTTCGQIVARDIPLAAAK